jgi:hypothetical protein
MSTHKKAPAMVQHGEGQTSEAENLSNGVNSIQQSNRCQAPARDDRAARSAPEGAPALPGGPEGGAAALPCLRDNNSNKSDLPSSGSSLVEHAVDGDEDAPAQVIKWDESGRVLIQQGDTQV